MITTYPMNEVPSEVTEDCPMIVDVPTTAVASSVVGAAVRQGWSVGGEDTKRETLKVAMNRASPRALRDFQIVSCPPLTSYAGRIQLGIALVD